SVQMDQLRTKRGYGRALQRSTVPMSAIWLVKHTQRFHRVVRQKLPPAHKQQSSVLVLICHLSDSSTSRTHITIMPIEDENLAEPEMHNVAQHVGKVHRHDLGPNRESPVELRRVRRTLGESDCRKEQPGSSCRNALRDSGNDDGIRSEGIVGTVELQAAERQNCEARTGHNLCHFKPDRILKSFWLGR